MPHSPPLTFGRRLAVALYLLLFTNAASWVFFFAVNYKLMARLPGWMQHAEVWFFGLWFTIVFAGISFFSANRWGLRLRLFLSGWLSVGLLHNCLWLTLFRLFGHSADPFQQTLGKLDWPVPFLAAELPTALLIVVSVLFIAAAILAVHSESTASLTMAGAGFLAFLSKSLGFHDALSIFLLIAAALAAPFAVVAAASEFQQRKKLWIEAFHPMVAMFAFVASACVVCFGTFHGGMLWADLTLYGVCYPIVIFSFGYAMVGNWHPLKNKFERAKLFIIFWLCEAIFYDWSWWLAYIRFGEPFDWSEPFYVDILIPDSSMLVFLIVGLASLALAVYTFLFVKKPRQLIPIGGYFFVLFAMVLYKMLLGTSSWAYAVCVYVLAIGGSWAAGRAR